MRRIIDASDALLPSDPVHSGPRRGLLTDLEGPLAGVWALGIKLMEQKKGSTSSRGPSPGSMGFSLKRQPRPSRRPALRLLRKRSLPCGAWPARSREW